MGAGHLFMTACQCLQGEGGAVVVKRGDDGFGREMGWDWGGDMQMVACGHGGGDALVLGMRSEKNY